MKKINYLFLWVLSIALFGACSQTSQEQTGKCEAVNVNEPSQGDPLKIDMPKTQDGVYPNGDAPTYRDMIGVCSNYFKTL